MKCMTMPANCAATGRFGTSRGQSSEWCRQVVDIRERTGRRPPQAPVEPGSCIVPDRLQRCLPVGVNQLLVGCMWISHQA